MANQNARLLEPRWWESTAKTPVFTDQPWVSFDLNSVVLEALAHNPRIKAVNHQAAVAMERIIQEDAVFDPALLLNTKYGSTSDPVGNTLTTGGPPRLHESSWDNKAGVVRTTRQGTTVDLSQSGGLLTSNSLFFQPENQGNTRLNLSVTKPLRAGSGQVYNERLIIQARLDSRITFQQMRQDIQQRIALTMATYWKIYKVRCHVLQQRQLIERGNEIERLVNARRDFDSGELEISRVNARMVRRRDELISLERDLLNLQTELAGLVASDALRPGTPLEMIPLDLPQVMPMEIDLRDAIVTAVSMRPDVKSAAVDLESAALEMKVTRNELLPQLDAVVGGYLAGLNGENAVLRSFGDQFADGRPGFNAGLVYEAPFGQRAARSRHRAAYQRLMELNERYREAVAQTQTEVETAARNLETATALIETKRAVWETSVRQEMLVKQRWETMGPEGRHAALVLEDLLNQQDSRTAAEKDVVAAEIDYLLSLIELQSAMGTILTNDDMTPSVSQLPVSGGTLDASAVGELPTTEQVAAPESLPMPIEMMPKYPSPPTAAEEIILNPKTDALIESEQ